jgi:transcriptional regulator with XRE-family HTH domain
MPIWGTGPVAEYFPINLREAREQRGLSQAELAQRVKDLGHSCTQATIWKLEQGHREPKLAEAAAIGQALGLLDWTKLATRPATFKLEQTVDLCRRQVAELAEVTRAAAAAQLKALLQLAFAVRQAQDGGAKVSGGGWLEGTPEVTVLREVLDARVASDSEYEEGLRKFDEAQQLETQILQALENSGVSLVIRPEDITFEGPDHPEPE